MDVYTDHDSNLALDNHGHLLSQSAQRSQDLLAFYRWVTRQTFTVVDVETTGTTAGRNRMIEVSILQASLADGVQTQKTHLLNPGVVVPPRIVNFTGITQEMVDGAEPIAAILPDCLDFLNSGVFTAHNLKFDYGFLQAEFRRLGIPFSRPLNAQLCTVKLARLLLADLPSRSLPYLVKHYGFEVGRSHRAEADTLACWLLAEKLLRQVEQEDDQTLLARFNQQWINLGQAAQLLNCLPMQAEAILAESTVRSRYSKSRKMTLYRCGDVELLAKQNVEDS
ncbi:3'-5' exonuclease [Thalassoporum mexicanum]|uniref:3'-5' exonuclease n=1 Tax=Thalassoporum mexicanum TaxID=3457544 RepID=UPI001CEC7148|nr:3'-5' exonuclease [Pseudanabaena sp. PCC 7367]